MCAFRSRLLSSDERGGSNRGCLIDALMSFVVVVEMKVSFELCARRADVVGQPVEALIKAFPAGG